MGIAALALDQRDPVGNGKGFLDMEITFFSVLSHSSVIIDTVSHIGILLNLCNQDAGSDGMDRTGLNE